MKHKYKKGSFGTSFALRAHIHKVTFFETYRNIQGRYFLSYKKTLPILALALVLILSACGGGGAPVSLDADKLASQLLSDVPFKDQMSEVDSSVFYMLYGLTEEDADTAVLISSTGATAEEIAVIHAASADKADAVLAAVNGRIEAQRDGFENYVPAEMEKLTDPVIEQIGDYVILCVSDHNAKAEEIIKQYR